MSTDEFLGRESDEFVEIISDTHIETKKCSTRIQMYLLQNIEPYLNDSLHSIDSVKKFICKKSPIFIAFRSKYKRLIVYVHSIWKQSIRNTIKLIVANWLRNVVVKRLSLALSVLVSWVRILCWASCDYLIFNEKLSMLRLFIKV